MELNGPISDVLNLPIQFWLITLSFLFLKNLSFSVKEVVIYIGIVFIPSIIIFNYLFWLGIIYIILAMVLYFYWKSKHVNSITYIFGLFIVAIIVDHLATSIITYLAIPLNLWILILRSIIFMFIFIILIFLFKIIQNKYKYLFKLSSKIKVLIILVILLTLVVFYFNIFIVYSNIDNQIIKFNTLVFLLYFLVLIFLIGSIIYIWIKEENLKAREAENNNFTTYINSLEHINKEMQKFRHDYMNVLISMKSYMDLRDWEGLTDYFEKDILNFEKDTLMENTILGNLKNLQITGLKGLLLTKSLYALESEISITIEIPDIINSVSANIIELNRVIGIVFDNAIENCIEDQRKEIQCAILKPSNSILLITVRNQIKNKDIPINKIFNEGYTTKKGQGLGLSTVKKIVENNPNMSLNVWIEENWFCFELLVLRGE